MRLAVLLLLMGCRSGPHAPYGDRLPPSPRPIVWHYCYDGDTCKITLPDEDPLFGERIGLRIWGVDTPEKRGKCAKEKALALSAQAFVWDRVKDGKATLHNRKRGKYFRIVARVKVADGWLDDLLVERGLGVRYFGKTKTKDWCK